MSFLEQFEIYCFLFVDSLVATLILPLNKVLIFKLMYYFGSYNYAIMLPVALAGSLVGTTINYYLGKIVIFARIEYQRAPEEQKKSKTEQYLRKTIPWIILFFAWIPLFGSIFTVVSGYIKINLKFTILMAALSYTVYYVYIYYYLI